MSGLQTGVLSSSMYFVSHQCSEKGSPPPRVRPPRILLAWTRICGIWAAVMSPELSWAEEEALHRVSPKELAEPEVPARHVYTRLKWRGAVVLHTSYICPTQLQSQYFAFFCVPIRGAKPKCFQCPHTRPLLWPWENHCNPKTARSMHQTIKRMKPVQGVSPFVGWCHIFWPEGIGSYNNTSSEYTANARKVSDMR